MSGDLIDTTEMYLRTIVELMEEGAPPLRARIAERLHQSSPTVSQTVARMERDGLLMVTGDRTIELSETGLEYATRVMRRHRLAERLLTDVIGIPLDQVHDEACRWEHVLSDAVERRLVEILDHPTETPYGTPIPGLDRLGEPVESQAFLDGVATLDDALGDGSASLVVRRLSENIQRQEDLLANLVAAGVLPGTTVRASRVADGVELLTPTGRAVLPFDAAADLYVEA